MKVPPDLFTKKIAVRGSYNGADFHFRFDPTEAKPIFINEKAIGVDDARALADALNAAVLAYEITDHRSHNHANAEKYDGIN